MAATASGSLSGILDIPVGIEEGEHCTGRFAIGGVGGSHCVAGLHEFNEERFDVSAIGAADWEF